MRISESQLRGLIRELLIVEAGDGATEMAKAVEKAGTGGKFNKWCRRRGYEKVNQSCVDDAASEGGEPAEMANMAVNFSKGKGGSKTLKYPKKKE